MTIGTGHTNSEMTVKTHNLMMLPRSFRMLRKTDWNGLSEVLLGKHLVLTQLTT